MENKIQPHYTPIKNCEQRIERIDIDTREIAIELAKLSVAVSKLDTDLIRSNRSIDELVNIGSTIISIKHQMSSIEDLLHKNHQINEQQNATLGTMEDRLDDLEHASKTLKTAIRWIAASIGLMLTQFGESLVNWLVNGHGK